MGRGRGNGKKFLETIGLRKEKSPAEKRKEEIFSRDFNSFWTAKGFSPVKNDDTSIVGKNEISVLKFESLGIFRESVSSEDAFANIFYDAKTKQYRGTLKLSRSEHDEKNYIAVAADYEVIKEFTGRLEEVLSSLKQETKSVQDDLWIKETEEDSKRTHWKRSISLDKLNDLTVEDIVETTRNKLTELEYKARLEKDERLRKEKIFQEAQAAVDKELI